MNSIETPAELLDKTEPAPAAPRPLAFRDVPWRFSHVLIGMAPALVTLSFALIPYLYVFLALAPTMLIATNYLWLLVYPLIIAWWNGWRPRWTIRPRQVFTEFGVALLAVAVTWGLLIGGIAIWDSIHDIEIRYNPFAGATLARNHARAMKVIPLACLGALVAALTDEIYFRGLLSNALRRFLPWGAAIPIQAAVFGLMHLPAGLIFVAITGMLGAGFGIVYQIRKTLLTPILFHAMHSMVLIAALLAVDDWENDQPLTGIVLTPYDEGLGVAFVMPGSGAEDAGLQKGDWLQSISGVEVRNVSDVQTALRGHKRGEKIPVDYVRDEKRYHAEVELRSTRDIIRQTAPP